jgi:hypothetical protein
VGGAAVSRASDHPIYPFAPRSLWPGRFRSLAKETVVKARYLLLVIAVFAIFPNVLLPACKAVFAALLQIAADLSGVTIR